MVIKKIFFSFILIFILSGRIFSLVELKNEFIKVIGHEDSGRFIIKTTGGDPELATDNDKLLLYEEYPPTSFTTIYIDNINYKFGDTEAGIFTSTMQEKNGILICIWRVGDFEITQALEIVQGPTTGRKDTVKISYLVANKGYRTQKVGIRIMFDTYLGKRDDSPFKIPGGSDIITETEFTSDKIPAFWYSYDKLDSPSIKVQGTLKDEHLTTPDKIIFASWGRFKKYEWDFSVDKSRKFERISGEPDSAVAIYWNPVAIEPNKQLGVSTMFGLYGATFYTGDILNVSLSGPTVSYGEPWTVEVNIENISPFQAENVTSEIELPAGLQLSSLSDKTKNLGDLKSKELKKSSYEITPDAKLAGEVEYSVTVKAKVQGRTRETKVSRKIKIDRKFSKKFTYKRSSVDLDFSRINKIIAELNKNKNDVNVKLDEINTKIEKKAIYTKETGDKDRSKINENKKNIEDLETQIPK